MSGDLKSAGLAEPGVWPPIGDPSALAALGSSGPGDDRGVLASLPPLAGIVVPLEGVLADVAEARRQAWNRVFAEAGLDWNWTPALYAELSQKCAGECIIRTFLQRQPKPWHETVDALALVAAIRRRHATTLSEMFRYAAVRLRPGTIGFLHAARREGLRVALISRERAADVEALLLAHLGPMGPQLFDALCVASADETIEATAIGALGVEAEHCVVLRAAGQVGATHRGDACAVTIGDIPVAEDGAALLAALRRTHHVFSYRYSGNGLPSADRVHPIEEQEPCL